IAACHIFHYLCSRDPITDARCLLCQKTKLLDEVRAVARLRHLSIRTGEPYVNWIEHYILFWRDEQLREDIQRGGDCIRAFHPQYPPATARDPPTVGTPSGHPD